jgi:hypothetical protein
MKGTLFSADFVKDANGNLRLLELNTDTGIVSEQINNIDWQSFVDILNNNSITKIDVIYKPSIHQSLVSNLSDFVSSSDTLITDFNIHPQDINTIYPTTIEDLNNTFILRIAYDESAIFDSTYCKNRLNLYKLYYDENSSDMITQFYYTSSGENYNSLSYEINPSNIPDVSVKDIDETFNPIDFYKLGHSNETNEERWNGLIQEISADDKLIEQYHFHSSSVDLDGCMISYRTFFIVYGAELDLVNIHSYKNTSIFDIPNDISSEITESNYSNKLNDYHYYEYTTNAVKTDASGLLSTEKIQMFDGDYKSLADVEVGDYIKSYYISGSPQVESDYTTMNWNYTGSEFPSGSFITSSVVVFKNTENLKYNGLIECVVDGDSLLSGTTKQFLVYDSGSNKTQFKHVVELNAETDYFYDYQGNLIKLDELNYYITTDSTVQLVELDVEDTDTYIISASTAFNAVVSHNAPCFIAGTEISLANGDIKNIEDIQIGDLVLTYNHDSNQVEHKEVEHMIHKIVDSTVRYIFNNNEFLECTLDHPLYSIEGQYVSYKPEQSKIQYELEVGQIEVGTKILLQDGSNLEIVSIEEKHKRVTVYNLHNVKDNHNFFANKMLVHNRCFDFNTPIDMWDGSIKKIGEIKVGDLVKSIKNNSYVKGIVTNTLIHPTNDIVPVIEYKNTIAEPNHPFLLNNEWINIENLKEGLYGYKFIDNFYNLEIDGHLIYESEHNFIVDGIVVSGLGDNKILNSVFMRQSTELLKSVI